MIQQTLDFNYIACSLVIQMQGRIQGRGGGGGRTRRSPPSKIGKNKIFWRKIMIFHTKYPNNFRASLRSAHFFKCAAPEMKCRSMLIAILNNDNEQI